MSETVLTLRLDAGSLFSGLELRLNDHENHKFRFWTKTGFFDEYVYNYICIDSVFIPLVNDKIVNQQLI